MSRSSRSRQTPIRHPKPSGRTGLGSGPRNRARLAPRSSGRWRSGSPSSRSGSSTRTPGRATNRCADAALEVWRASSRRPSPSGPSVREPKPLPSRRLRSNRGADAAGGEGAVADRVPAKSRGKRNLSSQGANDQPNRNDHRMHPGRKPRRAPASRANGRAARRKANSRAAGAGAVGGGGADEGQGRSPAPDRVSHHLPLMWQLAQFGRNRMAERGVP